MRNAVLSASPKIQSVSRALAILEFLAAYRNGEKLTVISRKLGLHKSTTHGLIATLESAGYVQQDQTTSKYSLGLKLFELGQVVHDNMDLRNIAMPFLEELAKEVSETVHLAVLSKGEVIYIDKVDTSHSIRIGSQIGGRNPAYCTGVGKVLLAGLTDKELTETLKNIKLKKFTANTILEKETLRKHLDRVRQDGFAIDEEEIEEGLCCIGAPIKNHSGQVIAGISVSGPSTRLRAHIEANLKTSVIDKAIQISRCLGFMA